MEELAARETVQQMLVVVTDERDQAERDLAKWQERLDVDAWAKVEEWESRARKAEAGLTAAQRGLDRWRERAQGAEGRNKRAAGAGRRLSRVIELADKRAVCAVHITRQMAAIGQANAEGRSLATALSGCDDDQGLARRWREAAQTRGDLPEMVLLTELLVTGNW